MEEGYKESLTIKFPYKSHILMVSGLVALCILAFTMLFVQAYTRTFFINSDYGDPWIHNAPLSMVIPAYIVSFIFAGAAMAVIFYEIKSRIKAPILKTVIVAEDGVTLNKDRILYSEGKKIKICKPSLGMSANEINIEAYGKRYFAGTKNGCSYALGLLKTGVGRYYPEGIQEEE